MNDVMGNESSSEKASWLPLKPAAESPHGRCCVLGKGVLRQFPSLVTGLWHKCIVREALITPNRFKQNFYVNCKEVFLRTHDVTRHGRSAVGGWASW